MEFTTSISEILLFAVALAGFMAVIDAIILVRMISKYNDKVEREVRRRLRGTKIVSNFNVRMVMVDDTPQKYEET